MEYPPTVTGFFRAVFDTLLGKKPEHKTSGDKHDSADIRDFHDFYYDSRDGDPGDAFWQKKAEEYIDRREYEKCEAERQMIEDYEFQHKDDVAEPEGEGISDFSNDGFDADFNIGTEFDSDFDA